MKYIVKISPEITIKSKPVRKQSISILQRNIKKHLDSNWVEAKVVSTWDSLSIEWNDESISNILKKIPGISNFLEVDNFLLPKEENQIFDFVFGVAKDYFLEAIENKTFVVRVNRSWSHNFRSIDLEKYVWWGLLQHSKNAKVKLSNPDMTINLEVKNNNLYIVKNRVEWIWWYPVWFQDRVLSLISWWFDSWVSTFSMMKRWCNVDFLFFNLGWSAHELWVKQVSYYLWRNFSVWYKNAKFITINFEEVIKYLVEKVNHKYRWIILKRFMLKAASIVSKDTHYALVKGDSLWQVSSQTLKNMHVIDKASSNLVLRPLISFNKQEIIDISKKIWTYNFACNMPEYCWVISDKPSTWAKEENILKEEANIDDDILIRAIETKQEYFVDTMLDQYKWKDSTTLDVVFLPWDNEVVIDIRETALVKKNPLLLEWVEVIEIPFTDINHRFWVLDNTKTYLLYCEKWVLSNLHWLYLKEKWYNNVKVYRKIEDDKSCKIK